MNKIENKPANTIAVLANALLVLVAERLKGRDLFPERTEEAKQFLNKIKTT